jgi:hypothetical protein
MAEPELSTVAAVRERQRIQLGMEPHGVVDGRWLAGASKRPREHH